MPLGIFKLVQIVSIVIIILGATASVLISNFVSCSKTLSLKSNECKSFLLSIGDTLFTPQIKMSHGIDKLQPANLSTIPDSVKDVYVNSIKAEIFFSLLISIVHLWIIYRILLLFPALDDIGTKMIVIPFALIIWLGLQGIYAQLILHQSFTLPFLGIVKLISNLDLLFKTVSEGAKTVGTEIVEPI